MKAVADTLGVSRSNLHERVSGKTKPRRRYHKAQDGERSNAMRSSETANILPLIERLVAKRPTYGYRRSCQWLRHWFEQPLATRC